MQPFVTVYSQLQKNNSRPIAYEYKGQYGYRFDAEFLQFTNRSSPHMEQEKTNITHNDQNNRNITQLDTKSNLQNSYNNTAR